MGSQTALLMGYYGARNVGDDLMLAFLLDWLRGQGLRVNILGEHERAAHFSLPGESFIKNVPMAGEWSFPKVWMDGRALGVARALKRADHFVVGGGDLFRDDRGWRTFLYPFEKVLLGLASGTPVHVVNVGIGAPTTGYGRRLYKWALPRCSTLFVRDRRSLRICRELGADHARLFPDVVFAAAEGDPPPREIEEPYVVVALRFLYEGGQNVGMSETRLKNLAGVLDRIVEDHGVRVVFVPFQDAAGWRDEELHRGVQGFMQFPDRVIQRSWSADFPGLVSLFRHARAVLSMPLHAAVVAARAKARHLYFPYDHKCWEMMEDLHGVVVRELEVLDDAEALLAAVSETLAAERVGGMEGAAREWAASGLNL